MKKLLFVLLISLALCTKVSAETHDVKAKYETKHNVNLVKTILNNNSKTLKIDKYEIITSSSLKNVEVVIIKPEEIANEYIKKVTNNIDNYYISFYKDNKKLTNSNVTIEFKLAGKKIKVYDSQSNQIEVTDNKVKLTSNDYYVTLTNTLSEIRDDYKIIDVNTLAEDIEGLEISNNTSIKIYNNKDELIENSKTLGTGYKVIINNNNNIVEHQIVVKGDTTGDSKINLNDITRLYHYYKLIESMSNPYVLAGDVATNDTINLNDITKIYHYHKKFITKL